MLENIVPILTLISTIAAVISAVAAVQAKNEVKKIRNQLNGDKNVQVTGSVSVNNQGKNTGVVSGVNTGNVRK